MRVGLILSTVLLAAFASSGVASGAPTVSGFSVTPSTTRAGGHPNLRTTITFSEPAGVKDLGLHLPAGLTANPRAVPFCSRKRLLADLCPRSTRVGSLTVVAVAYGFDLPVTREIYNAQPRTTERLRLAVPILGSYSRPGIAAELPVTERPTDKGLDITVTGLPNEVYGVPIRARELSFSLKGVSRRKIKRRIRIRAFLTNPTSCTPAASVLELNLHDSPTTMTASSAFTPSGC
jgi:hypothetical protein